MGIREGMGVGSGSRYLTLGGRSLDQIGPKQLEEETGRTEHTG